MFVTMVCDLQFGSTGKGLIAGYLAERDEPDVVVTAWGPNAGHTYVDRVGRRFVHRALANGVVSPRLRRVLIAPGSCVDLGALHAEVTTCADFLRQAEILVHPHAAVLRPHHAAIEAGRLNAIGSTQKGTAAAYIEKMWRSRDAARKVVAADFAEEVRAVPGARVCSPGEYLLALRSAERVLAEGAQGYSLGINSGFYPYTTSRECTPAQMASDMLIATRDITRIVGTARTFPIRVANRYDAAGTMVGWSGPGYHDQRELTFADIGQEQEMTTVTKLPRRIFSFSLQQMADACAVARPHDIFLNFCNYCDDDTVSRLCLDIDRVAGGGGVVRYLGYGPTADDIVDLSSKLPRRRP